MTGPIWSWSIADVRSAVIRRQISPVEVVQSVADRIAARADINAYITVLVEQALLQARDRERDLSLGHEPGPLHGIPISLKDNIATSGIETTVGSGSRVGWIPDRDADVVRSLRDAGAVIIGKNNLFEIAFGAAHPRFGETRNPWDHRLTCGGSSSGSAAAVADGQAFGAIGTDTGGSIRIPAAMCGIVGLKLSMGLVSNRGVVPVSADLDVTGPMTRTVDDAAILLHAMVGKAGSLRDVAEGLCVGVPRDLDRIDVAPEVAAGLNLAIDRLEEGGARLVAIDLPDLTLALDVMWIIASAEVAEYYRTDLAERPDYFCKEVRNNLTAGAMIPALDYIRARRLRHVLTAETFRVFSGVDAVLLPSQPIVPYRSGAQTIVLNGTEQKVLPVVMRYTPLANITGQPAIVVPLRSMECRPPMTVQLYGRPGGEATLISAARLIERDDPIRFPD